MILGELKNEPCESFLFYFSIGKCRNAVRAIPYRNQRRDTVYRCHGFIYGHRISFFFWLFQGRSFALICISRRTPHTITENVSPSPKKQQQQQKTRPIWRPDISSVFPCVHIHPASILIDDAWKEDNNRHWPMAFDHSKKRSITAAAAAISYFFFFFFLHTDIHIWLLLNLMVMGNSSPTL